MNDTPTRASAVIIGAGIVGNSLASHLARLGWTDLVLVDKGAMPNPGGSTGHASNFIFPIEYSKMMMELTRDSTEQYQALGVHTQSGGIEVARTEARMQELRRRCTAAKAWGIPAQLVSPAEVAKRAGNSVEVLLKRYAGCLDNQEAAVNRRIEQALDEDTEDDQDDPEPG